MTTSSFISKRLDDIAARTPRCNEIIRREPRELPRRLRGLVLAIDGRQTIRTYIATLKGFGDVEALLTELATLGLIELRSSRRKRPPAPAGTGLDIELDSQFSDSRMGPVSETEGTFGGISPIEDMMDDPAKLFQTFAERTMPGSFDDLVRVAQLEDRSYVPPSPPPPGKEADISRQVESLFMLLEAVRGERKALREKITHLRKYRQQAESLALQNGRLINGVYALAATCLLLVGLLVLMAFLRR